MHRHGRCASLAIEGCVVMGKRWLSITWPQQPEGTQSQANG